MPNFNEREDALARLRDVADVDADRLSSDGLSAPEPIAQDASGQAAVQEDGPVVVYDEHPISTPFALRHPFSIDGERVAALHFREPSFSDVEDCLLGRITEHELHARMAGVHVRVLRALRWSDSEIMTLVARTIAPELRSR